jgi:hypothetical protein
MYNHREMIRQRLTASVIFGLRISTGPHLERTSTVCKGADTVVPPGPPKGFHREIRRLKK